MLIVNKPKSLNALDTKLLAELDDCLSSLRQQKDSVLKGMIFTGSGEKAFIAGADIKEMSANGNLGSRKVCSCRTEGDSSFRGFAFSSYCSC